MRSRPFTLLAIGFASLTVLAHAAQAKPKVAVLGLEVAGESAMDRKATEAAKALTRELRREARAPGGAFDLAPNSNKDLLEMKLLSDCSDEGKSCMSEIGRQLGAERLLYGKLERTRRGYALRLRLLDTEDSQILKELNEIIPFSDVTATGGLQRRAKALYGEVTGGVQEGALAITASAPRGTVYVDGQIKTSLSAGSARVSGLTEGVHTIAIEARGYERFETEVSIESGGTRNLRANLIEVPDEIVDESAGQRDAGRPGRGWRIAFWSGVIVAGAAGAGWTYSGLTVRSEEKNVDEATGNYDGTAVQPTVNNQGTPEDPSDDTLSFPKACDTFKAGEMNDPNVRQVLSSCDTGDKHRDLVNRVWIPVTAAAAVFSIFAAYKGYIAAGKSSSERDARRRGKKSRVTVMPTVGPNLVGAGLELQF
jgi:PEGA domain